MQLLTLVYIFLEMQLLTLQGTLMLIGLEMRMIAKALLGDVSM
jgi:hypothetical protein